MGKVNEPFQKIVNFLNFAGVEYEVLRHRPVITSREASALVVPDHVRGVKSLLFQTDHSLILLVVQDEDRVSSGKVRKLLATKQLRMVSPETVEEVMGCPIGGCYPLGPVCEVEMLVDKRVSQASALRFNAGRRDTSIQISWSDYENALGPRLGDIVQEEFSLN